MATVTLFKLFKRKDDLQGKEETSKAQIELWLKHWQIAIRQIKMTPIFSGANAPNFLLANIFTYTVDLNHSEKAVI